MSSADISALLAEAHRLHSADDLNAAAAVYQQIAQVVPAHSLASLRLGILNYQRGQLEEATRWLERSVALAPTDPQAPYVLGLVARRSRQPATALSYLARAIELNPNFEQAHGERAALLMELGHAAEAIEHLRQATTQLPTSTRLLSDLAAYLTQDGQHEESEKIARLALASNESLPNAWVALGGSLMNQKHYADAADAFRRALTLNPKATDALICLGGVLTNLQQWDESLAVCRQGVALSSDNAVAHFHLGRVLELTRQYAEAEASYNRALALRPGYAVAEWGRAMVLLATGRYAEGWLAYEARWRCPENLPRVRHFPQPRWDGRSLAGRTLFLYAEQGMGDAIQFARYIPILAGMGARVLFECPMELHRLMRTLDGVAELLTPGQPLPSVDLQCPQLSVGQFLTPSVETIPARVPYLAAQPELVEQWKQRLKDVISSSSAGAPVEGREVGVEPLNVGIVWAGNPGHPSDARRSCRLADLAPLGQVPGVRLFSLQKGAAAEQLRDGSTMIHAIDLDPELSDFADTAAALMALDLLITVDTSTAHLAGALARPVWTLLPFSGEWRWLAGRTDSPWYPTMRLFQQSARGDWASVVENVARALDQFCRSRRMDTTAPMVPNIPPR